MTAVVCVCVSECLSLRSPPVSPPPHCLFFELPLSLAISFLIGCVCRWSVLCVRVDLCVLRVLVCVCVCVLCVCVCVCVCVCCVCVCVSECLSLRSPPVSPPPHCLFFELPLSLAISFLIGCVCRWSVLCVRVDLCVLRVFLCVCVCDLPKQLKDNSALT